MQSLFDETVGNEFSVDRLRLARDKTLEVIVKSAKQIKPGTTELEARAIIKEWQTLTGSSKAWHPPQIRFGESTLLSFGAKGRENQTLRDSDIFFFDLGLVYDNHEGDVGRSFTVGDDPEMQRCCQDVERIWFAVYEHWKQNQARGNDLYQFAKKCAEDLGWELTLQGARGHRIADFPHSAGRRGSVEGLSETPAADRWILEIQIRHPTLKFGAFYEDLLG